MLVTGVGMTIILGDVVNWPVLGKVLVITQDGRTIVGELRGFDQTTNIILSGAVERVYSMEDGVEEVQMGLYIVRGDNITLVGEVDTEMEQKIDLSEIRAEPMGEVKH